MFQDMGNTGIIAGGCAESHRKYFVVVIIFHQQDPGSRLFMTEYIAFAMQLLKFLMVFQFIVFKIALFQHHCLLSYNSILAY